MQCLAQFLEETGSRVLSEKEILNNCSGQLEPK